LPVFFACTHAGLFSGEERKKRQIWLNTSSGRFSFRWYRSVACVYFSQQLPLHLLLSKLNFMQLLRQTVFELHRHSFRFIDPSPTPVEKYVTVTTIYRHKNVKLNRRSHMEFMPYWSIQRIESCTKTWLFPLQYAFWIETNQSRESSRTFDPFQLKPLKEICSREFKTHCILSKMNCS